MITISLQKIRDQSPCQDGWEKLLKAKGGKKADMGAQFPLSDVLESNDLEDTLWCLRCLPEHNNLWRKYAVWCARQVRHLMTDQRSINALDVAWRHSDGEATDAELAAAWAAGAARAAWDAWAAGAAARDAEDAAWAAARAAARAVSGAVSGAAARAAARAAWAAWDAGAAARDAARAAWAAGAAEDAARAARAAQKAKLIQILTAGSWVDDTKEKGE